MIVYKIVNSINDKVYIGITSKTLNERFTWHLRDCRRGITKKLYTAIRELGEENFSIELLETCNSDNIREKEEHYIMKYNAYDTGYNASPKSGGVRSHSVETKTKMSIIATGRKASEETKQKLSAKQREIWDNASDEKLRYYAELASKRNKGRSRTLEQNEHHSKIMTGKKHSAQTIEKMKKSHTGKIHGSLVEPVECPHCGTWGRSNAMYRWHFNNCKEKK